MCQFTDINFTNHYTRYSAHNSAETVLELLFNKTICCDTPSLNYPQNLYYLEFSLLHFVLAQNTKDILYVFFTYETEFNLFLVMLENSVLFMA